MSDRFLRMQQRYIDHAIPWDDPLPPPEVIELDKTLQPGRMLDLGCGAGRASIYFASHGWECSGVDFVPQAIEMSRERAEAVGVSAHIDWYVASVTQLDFLQPYYDLALDVGCMHGLETADDMRAYAAEVARLVRVGGYYLLFARLQSSATPSDLPGVQEDMVYALFQPTFHVKHVTHGVTETSESSWLSAWFWMVRE